MCFRFILEKKTDFAFMSKFFQIFELSESVKNKKPVLVTLHAEIHLHVHAIGKLKKKSFTFDESNAKKKSYN